MEIYYVRFRVAGVWNQSDPIASRDAAERYAAYLGRFGGVSAAEVTGPVHEDNPMTADPDV